MKKILIYSALLLWMFVSGVACSSDSTDTPAPQEGDLFPALVEAEIQPGENYTLSFTVQAAWKVSVPTASANLFWIQDGEHVRYSLSGEAGSHQVVIACADIEDFEQDARCEVTMQIGGENREVLRLTRPKAEYGLKVYAAQIDSENNDFFYNEEDYSVIYEQQPSTATRLIWPTEKGNYMQWIRVESNFAWTIGGEIPAWLTVPVTTGEKGLTEGFRLDTNPYYYPAEETSHKLLFQDQSQSPALTVVEFEVTIPGSKDYLTLSLGQELLFNNDGHYINDGTPVEIGVHANWTASYGAQIYLLSYLVNAKGVTVLSGDEQFAGWMNLTLGEWDESYGQEGIQTRRLNITCEANTSGEERKALVVALPASVAAKVKSANALLNSEYTDLKEEYKSYIVSTLTQTDVQEAAKPSLCFLSEAEANAQNAFLEELTEGEKFEQYASYGVPVYELTFVGEQNRPMAILSNGNYPFEYEEGVKWLAYDRSDYATVAMNKSKMPSIPATGAIFFYQEVEENGTYTKGDLFYILLCTYKEA